MPLIAWCIIAVVVLILLGMHIGTSFLVVSIFFELATGGGISSFARTAFSASGSSSMLAMPLFMLGGVLMEKSGIAQSLIDWCESFLGKVKGDMSATVPLVSMLFGTLCGSGLATISTIGTIMIPRLEKIGYEKRYRSPLRGLRPAGVYDSAKHERHHLLPRLQRDRFGALPCNHHPRHHLGRRLHSR